MILNSVASRENETALQDNQSQADMFASLPQQRNVS